MRPKSQPKPVTRERLEASALFYLERFASTAANLRRVLMRRVRRSVSLCGTDPAEGAALVDALIARYVASGLIDDRAYAEAKTASLHRRGISKRGIAAKLAAKGIEPALATDALSETRPGGDLAAAAALARRRKLGPYRPADVRAEYRLKDLGTFARAGFTRLIAERVLDCPDPESAQALTEPTA